MSNLNLLFRNKIGIPNSESLTFENLDSILEKTAKILAFGNLSILENRTAEITKENLINKVIIQNEAGLCYDLNPILSFFLQENGFNIVLIRGIIYDHTGQQWSAIGKTHVFNIINHNEQFYIIDTGFGGNLPLKPVPLSGETVKSMNGEFRVDSVQSEHGDYILFMKLKHKDKDWEIGYAFDSKEIIKNITVLNKIQKIILRHPESPFNKKPLLTRLTDRGSIILTETSFTEWVDGEMKKKKINQKQFKEIAKEHFGIQPY
ncbi:MAG TPA: arylamine N-acetyltransferase [Sporosarcina psychrophila]|uniref:Arylamine N-acetyltransferase n=1 Tax=Sporosarcina psychrophila TaxID=1476 RepID=A0A921FWV5_SPOPS|nr:arylamine N-acetyltransferase [Sporosarcina psychrophila]